MLYSHRCPKAPEKGMGIFKDIQNQLNEGIIQPKEDCLVAIDTFSHIKFYFLVTKVGHQTRREIM